MNNHTARLLMTAVQRQSLQPPKLKAQAKATSQPHQFAVTIVVRVDDWPTAQKSEPIGKW